MNISSDKLVNCNLMYCTIKNGAYCFVDSALQAVYKTSISNDEKVMLDQKLFSVNETDYVNLIFAIKLDVIKERNIEMRDGFRIRVSREKTESLLNWFLLI